MTKAKPRKGPPSKEQYELMSPAQRLVILNTEERKNAIIEALREKFTVHAACRAVDCSRRTYYDWRESDANFAERCDEALQDSVDRVEEGLFNKALAGKDTIATIFFLKGNKPERYRERASIEHTGKNGGPIEVDSARNALANALGVNTRSPSKAPKE